MAPGSLEHRAYVARKRDREGAAKIAALADLPIGTAHPAGLIGPIGPCGRRRPVVH